MAFKLAGSLLSDSAPVLKKATIGNTVTITELASVKVSSGFLALNTAAALVFGHVAAIADSNNLGMTSSGAAGAAIGSFVGTFTTASDNQTVAQVGAECDVSKYTLYSVTPDAAPGVTTGSNLLGYYTDVANSTTTSESSALATILQYHIWGVDQNNSANQIVNIARSLPFGT